MRVLAAQYAANAVDAVTALSTREDMFASKTRVTLAASVGAEQARAIARDKSDNRHA